MPKASSNGSAATAAGRPQSVCGPLPGGWTATGVLEHNPYRLDIVEAQTGDRQKLLHGTGKRHYKGSGGGGATTMLSLDGSQPAERASEERPAGSRKAQNGYAQVRAENLTLHRTYTTDHDEGPLDKRSGISQAKGAKTVPAPARAKNLTLARETETRELLHGVPTPTRSDGGYSQSPAATRAVEQPGIRRRNDELRSTTLENVFIGPQKESQPRGPFRPEMDRMSHARSKYIDGKPQYEKDFLASRQSDLMDLRNYNPDDF